MEHTLIAEKFPSKDNFAALQSIEKFAPLGVAHVASRLGVNRCLHATILLVDVFIVNWHSISTSQVFSLGQHEARSEGRLRRSVRNEQFDNFTDHESFYVGLVAWAEREQVCPEVSITIKCPRNCKFWFDRNTAKRRTIDERELNVV